MHYLNPADTRLHKAEMRVQDHVQYALLNQYDQFFQEENLMQQTIRERANRGVATSFNKFQFGGEVNNLVVEPRFEEEAPLQAEIGEMIKLPNDDIVKVGGTIVEM